MSCEECELLLAQDEVGPEVEKHVAGCVGCRSLAAELQANAHAMRALGEEIMPSVAISVAIPERHVPWFKWTSAAAAVIITLAAAWWISRPAKAPPIASVDVRVTGVIQDPVPAAVKPVKRAAVPVVPIAHTEPLKVKMLTPDPDVVIYWLIDAKGDLE